jgi:uncharacterized protein YkwD
MTATGPPRQVVLAVILALLLVSAGCLDVDTYTGPVETFTPTPTPEPTPVAHDRDQPGNASLYVPEDRTKGNAPWTAIKVEQAIEEEINERRRNHGLEPLTVDPRYRTGPRNWSYWMDQRDDTAHRWEDNPESGLGNRMRADGYNCTGGAEIVNAWVNVYSDTPEELAKILVDRWMNSSDHREAILRDSYVGDTFATGIYVDSDEDLWATTWLC